MLNKQQELEEFYRGIDEWKCAMLDLKKFAGFLNFKGRLFVLIILFT